MPAVSPSLAWGPDGHIIAGLAAQPLLCDAATAEILTLGNEQSLAELGLWADRIRGDPQWQHAAPWHFVNISDDGDPRRPAAGAVENVVTAIDRFQRSLVSDSLSEEERGVALRFLVHFVADIHQPLHVGRAEDRGGNRIEVTYQDVATNLHAFWDSHAIGLSGRNVHEYVDAIAARIRTTAEVQSGTHVRDWAAQVFALRDRVYEFDLRTGHLDADYLVMAADLAEQQLILAAAHLANSLNEMLCR
jgi:hypothetical protein